MKLDALAELRNLDIETRRFARVSAVLQWDQETYLPERAVEERAEQIALVEGIAHERAVNPRIETLLSSLGSTTDNPAGDASLDTLDRDFLRVLRLDYDRKTKLPHDLVVDMARDAGLSQAAWVAARKANDFASFAPHLRKMVDYARRRAACWGFADTPYDGLLDEYERGMTEERIEALFSPLADRLRSLLQRIRSRASDRPAFLSRDFPTEKQDAFCRSVMTYLGFELERGRLDLSAHPFTTTLGDHDVRITTRYYPANMLSGLFSVIHETGHALYELGFDPALRGGSLADGSSMGIHESQSRLWENVIGRGRPFWKGRFEQLRSFFPSQLDGVALEDFYRAVNDVRPGLIRVDADEVGYSLHVILRFDLERRLFAGTLQVEELPAAWKQGMRDLLGIEPETDADGVLQDIHWSMGAFGYFPSYALGNLYGLQIWDSMRTDLPDLDACIERGDYAVALSWLRDRVHRYGRRLTPAELIQRACGGPLSADHFINYLECKYSELYGL